MGKRWGKPVDKPLRRRRSKGRAQFGQIFASARALSTKPVDKPADSIGTNLLRARRSKERKRYGEKMTNEIA